ncbi:MAG: PKD domain-containing protein [Bacteroidales bacterium]|nr:PKD domain-containing protein [Bacteroidales bacterium]
MKTRFLLLLLLTLSLKVIGQTDTLFWFAVPYASLSHDGPLTANLTLSATDEVNITTVTISQPYNPQFAPITVQIDPAVSLTHNITFSQADILKFSNNLYNSKSNSALLIRANREITTYYEIHRTKNNPAIFALKGKNALGQDFWTPFQDRWDNHDWDAPSNDPAFSQICIVATQDNTTVTVRFQKPAFGYAANVDHTITLDKGQTYMFVPRANAADNNEPSILAADRLIGTHITSNRPISVTLGDDSVEKSTAYDYMGDQHIPVKNAQNKPVIGYEYVLMKGKITDLASGSNEKAYIVTTKNNTSITVTRRNGTVTTHGPFPAGHQLTVDILGIDNDFYVHIAATEPVYVMHLAGFGHEMGNAILPTIDGCTGSLTVSFVRSKDQPFYLNLMTQADAIDSFYISVNGAAPVPFFSASDFEQAGTSNWYVLKDAVKEISTAMIPDGVVTRIFNTKNVFHLGYFNGVTTGGGCVYGYFSDYNELEASANVEDQGTVFQVCGADSIQLRAKGGISYHWSPTEYLDDPNVQNPILRPPYGGFEQVFKVEIEQPCYGFVSLNVWVIVPKSPNAFLAVNKTSGCAPIDIKLIDASDGANFYVLDLGDGTPPIFSPTPINLTHNYPNNTDTIADYVLGYTVTSDDGCNDYFTDTIRVFPEIVSNFELIEQKDTAVCHATNVLIQNTSSGNTDKYLWNFGDGSSDIDTLVAHTYNNFGANDTTYKVNLIATSPYGCKDTSDFLDIRVFPYIYASFAVDTAIRCSPAELLADPTVSIGVDTFYWSISDRNKTIIDDAFSRLDESPIILNHNNPRAVPDTIYFAMNAVNRFGCTDTATTRPVVIYPGVHAEFDMDKIAICDSMDVLFTNHSTGYNLQYEWDFGNGTSISDTSSGSFSRYYLNRSNHDTIYTIKLTATSDYYCKDTFSLPLTVYPFVNANFAIDYSNNCSPLNAEFTNTSKGGTLFDWDFGDGYKYNTLIPETLHHVYENYTDHDTTFYIWLKAVNNQGCSDSIRRSVYLFPQVAANFDFTSPNAGCNPLNVSFQNTSKGTNLNYQWDFGDNTFSTSQNPPPKLYQNATSKDTTYYVNLTVMNLAGCDSSITKTVEVYSKVTADFSIERVDSCSPFKIRVDNFSSGGITDFIWKYTENDSIIKYDFSDPDIPVYHNQSDSVIRHPIVLRTQNSHGCPAFKTDTITVFPEMHADFHPDVLAGCQPMLTGLDNNSNIIPGTSFFWNFGDGKYSNLTEPIEHIYNNLTNNSVTHNILLQATTQYGCYDDTTITVEVYPYIYAKFSIDRPAICSDELFSIDRSGSAGAIKHYYWDYDDGTPVEDKTTPEFTYTYSNTGTEDINPHIRLTVTNEQGCDTSWTETIAVHPEVRAKFNIDNQEACYPLSTNFTNLSEPAVPLTYYWNFGDGSSSVNKDPVHAYKNFSRTDDRTFNVSLTTTSEYGCDSTISGTVVIHPKPLADFNFPLAVDCPPFPVQFTDNSMGTSLDYNWDFSTGNTSNDMNPTETFYNSGSTILENPVTLIVTTDFNCADTVVKPVQVYPGVMVDFDASDWSGCNPMQINLNGTATNENEYYWYVDGKAISNYEDPSYRFVNESAGDKVFTVQFKAVSINGCFDDTIKQISIFPKPLAEFLPSPQAQEFNTDNDITPVTMNNQTNNQSIWGYQWDYGDGTTSTQSAASFIKNYTVWGDISNESRIPVNLIATNTNHPECSDTVMHFVIIRPPLPKVDLGPDVAGCLPLTVSFPSTAKYNYPDQYQWDLGFNGQSSTDNEPTPLVYDAPGVYIVRLTVQGDGGSNWDYKTITVHPKPVANFDFEPDSAWVRSQTEAGTPIKFFNLSGPGYSYSWDFDKDNRDPATSNEYEPSHEYQEEGAYYVTLMVENIFGCLDTFENEIPIIIYAGGVMEFPNAITIVPGDPEDENYNPDEANAAIFRPKSYGVEKYRLEIYNRWGELIFESDDVNKGWNGHIDGSPVKQDVYVWRVSGRFTNGRPFVKAGDLTVLVKQP